MSVALPLRPAVPLRGIRERQLMPFRPNHQRPFSQKMLILR